MLQLKLYCYICVQVLNNEMSIPIIAAYLCKDLKTASTPQINNDSQMSVLRFQDWVIRRVFTALKCVQWHILFW
jgi:hypothetical protein